MLLAMARKYNLYFQAKQQQEITLLLLKTIKSLLKEHVNSISSKIFDLIYCLQSPECMVDVVTDSTQHNVQMVAWWMVIVNLAQNAIAKSEFQVHYISKLMMNHIRP